MRRTLKAVILILILITGIIFSASAQVSGSGPQDLIVLLDTSASMSSYFRETSDYLIGPFLREFLRLGDTFHLISFSGTPRLEISRRIQETGDVEAIIGRMLLMYPLDPDSDIVGALNFVDQYAASLPGGRQKKIVLISDGDNGNQAVETAISSRQGLQFIRVPVTGQPSSGRPVTPASQTAQTQPSSAQTSTPPSAQTSQTPQTSTPSQQTQTPQTTTTQPQAPASTTQQPETNAPAQQITPSEQQPSSPSEVITQAPSQTQIETATPTGTQTTTPQAGTPSSQTTPPPASTATGSTVQTPGTGTTQTPTTTTQTQPPASGQTASKTQSSSVTGLAIPLPIIIGLVVLILLILALIIFLASRRLHRSPNRTIAQAASAPPKAVGAPMPDHRDRVEAERQDKHKSAEMLSGYAQNQKNAGAPPLVYPAPARKPMPKDKTYDDQIFDGKPIMLSLFVQDQNTAIGRRNIHTAKAGTSFTVGGGNSDFLVFLVPLPSQIGEVRFDGRQCTFTPRKQQYFPDLGSQQISNCIGKNIRVISDKNYELFIRIERYEDPLTALNKLLNSISIPGL